MDGEVIVYRFRRVEDWRVISPRHMWGTAESIAALGGWALLPETARTVRRRELEHGFVFDRAFALLPEGESRG
jgi:hypothetical protein